MSPVGEPPVEESGDRDAPASGRTMLELLQSGDPDLVDAVRNLLAARRERHVLAGWQSAFGPEGEPLADPVAKEAS
jgi:hypothetical protein